LGSCIKCLYINCMANTLYTALYAIVNVDLYISIDLVISN